MRPPVFRRSRALPRQPLSLRLLVLASFAVTSPHAAAGPAASVPTAIYHFDERTATIRFRFKVAGLLRPGGDFRHFSGTLSIDAAHPEQSSIAVQLDSSAIDVSLPGGAGRLRSADYFDAVHFPSITFHSTHVTQQPAGHFGIQGILTIRGVSRMQTLDAQLARAPTAGRPDADIAIRGRIARTDFGMTADRPLVSDDIALAIRVTLPTGEVPR